jgi:hypothetical protein
MIALRCRDEVGAASLSDAVESLGIAIRSL